MEIAEKHIYLSGSTGTGHGSTLTGTWSYGGTGFLKVPFRVPYEYLPAVSNSITVWGARMAIIIGITWRWTGYNTIIMIAGLKNIPLELYESADIDGANAFQKFFYITIPMVKSIILFVSITSTIGTLQLFDESFILTGGGPDNATITIGHYLYNTGFSYYKFGYAAAISYALVVIIGILSIIQFRMSKGGED